MSMIEFRDSAGNFILGWILGSSQVAVLRSNISNCGDILVKPLCFSWGEAARETGTGTRLSPFGLLESTRISGLSALDEDMRSDTGGRG